MLLSANHMQDFGIEASDGSLGKVDSFLFDDNTWHIRYMVVDTHVLWPGRKVLLHPQSIATPKGEYGIVPVNLSREQIRNSPDIDADLPVSRRHEIDLYKYYGWTPYWDLGFGNVAGPVPTPGLEQEEIKRQEPDQTNLRSTREVTGYSIGATDGAIGHVSDFIFDVEKWVLRYFVGDAGRFLRPRQVLISPEWVQRIDWGQTEVNVTLSRQEVQDCPEYDPLTPVNREYEMRMYDYYGRPKYWT